jgi:hypothetical protein
MKSTDRMILKRWMLGVYSMGISPLVLRESPND